jgi:hypothetical protein
VNGWDGMYVLLNIDQGHGWRKTSMLCCSSARAFMAAAALSSRVGSWQLAVLDMDRTTSPPSTPPTRFPRRSPRPYYFHSNTAMTGGCLFWDCNCISRIWHGITLLGDHHMNTYIVASLPSLSQNTHLIQPLNSKWR